MHILLKSQFNFFFKVFLVTDLFTDKKIVIADYLEIFSLNH